MLIGIIPLWLTGVIPLRLQPRQANGEPVHRASHSPSSAVQDMGVDHRGAHVGVSQQFLNRADVVAIFQQMGGKGMAQGVRARESLRRVRSIIKASV